MNAYDFKVIQQQLFKFYSDKHIKVSLFIQDKLQSINGKIHLNFVGKAPVFTPAANKPGLIKIYKPGNPSAPVVTKQVQMLHTNKMVPNNYETRLEGNTQPWLGANMYADNREEPRVPW